MGRGKGGQQPGTSRGESPQYRRSGEQGGPAVNSLTGAEESPGAADGPPPVGDAPGEGGSAKSRKVARRGRHGGAPD